MFTFIKKSYLKTSLNSKDKDISHRLTEGSSVVFTWKGHWESLKDKGQTETFVKDIGYKNKPVIHPGGLLIEESV